MNSKVLTLAILSALAAVQAPASAQPSPNYQTGRANWLATRYPQTIPPLKTYRTEPFGRTAEVDYMLGTSGCRTAGERQWGTRVLNFVLYSYSLSEKSRAQVAAQRDLCQKAGQLASLSAGAQQALPRLATASATARGKIFYFAGDKQIAAYPARQIRALSRADLDRRLVPLGQSEKIATVLKSVAPAARVQVVGRYAFAVHGSQTAAEVTKIASTLDRFLAFLETEYAIMPPETYLTIHLVPAIGTVRRVADKVHGLDVSPSTLGYAFQDDLSTVAMTQGAQAGTLLHELFHLVVRQSFGDIPQWLDEGVASLYEVSRFEGPRLRGLPNWRGRVLVEAYPGRPKLADVIASPWFGFDLTGTSGPRPAVPIEEMALNLATARYLALFLQERGDLKAVFAAFRTRDPAADDDPAAGAVRIVASRTAPIDQLQSEYDAWFKALRGADDTNAFDTIGKTMPGSTKS